MAGQCGGGVEPGEGGPCLVCHRTGGVADVGLEDFSAGALGVAKVLGGGIKEERGSRGGGIGGEREEGGKERKRGGKVSWEGGWRKGGRGG